VQQGWFLPPQAPQPPLAAQVPAPAQDCPLCTQAVALLPVRTQQPEAQRLPGQQGPPASPHFWQVLPAGPVTQTAPASVQAGDDEQHALPSLPQTHWPAVHVPKG
jgi:hypothetical protein